MEWKACSVNDQLVLHSDSQSSSIRCHLGSANGPNVQLPNLWVFQDFYGWNRNTKNDSDENWLEKVSSSTLYYSDSILNCPLQKKSYMLWIPVFAWFK